MKRVTSEYRGVVGTVIESVCDISDGTISSFRRITNSWWFPMFRSSQSAGRMSCFFRDLIRRKITVIDRIRVLVKQVIVHLSLGNILVWYECVKLHAKLALGISVTGFKFDVLRRCHNLCL